MTGSSLLDTNLVVAALNGKQDAQDFLRGTPDVVLSATVVGELYFGAFKSVRVAANIGHLENFITKMTVLICDTETARYYGRIKNGLRAKGKPIPENDTWIAAVAMQHRMTLVTRDAHFDEIDGLTVARW